MRDPEAAVDSTDFSLVAGGPLHRLFLRTRMARQPLELLGRRVVLVTLLAWLPVLVLTALDSTRSSPRRKRTNRFSLNLIWSPSAPLWIGGEYIWGERINQDGSRGTSQQVQLNTRYSF